jgi:outer membrane biosynthesis protein TonB
VNLLTQALRFDAGGVDRRVLAGIRFQRPVPLFLLAAIMSVGTHAIVLAILGLWFRFTRPLPTRGDTLPVSIIYLPANGLAGGGGGSMAINHPAHQTAHRVPKRSTVVAMPGTKVRRHIMTKPVNDQVVNRTPLELNKSPDSEQNKTASSSKTMPVPGSPIRQGLASAGSSGTGTGVGGGNGSGSGAGSGTGTGDGYGNGGSGPRAVYAPAPSIPDDMRDEVLQATAIARFEVSRDGTAKVTLLNATDYSELDDIILDTLKQWRFRPAMKNGIAIDSVADVRLLITVK